MRSAIQNINFQNGLEVLEARPLSGGDINEVFLLKTSSEAYVLKLNKSDLFPGMFEKEAKGLQLLEASHSFIIPKVIETGTSGSYAYLLLEYIAPRSKHSDFWPTFGRQLASLHGTTQDTFGLDHSNYIGSLVQHNGDHNEAGSFYISERLEPQLKLAIQRGFSFANLDLSLKHISEAIPKESPALIHGDLWNGNYLVSSMGTPVLIDPAVAYAPREMDLAMMLLFGGFPSEVISEYNNEFRLNEDWENRVPLWQLYYLLVHLNLFGAGYLSQVQNVLRSYT